MEGSSMVPKEWPKPNAPKVKKPRNPSERKTPKFPQRLWELVNNDETGSIYWNKPGNGIVLDHTAFERHYLATGVFTTAKIASFVRQLNLYGFRKSKKNCTSPDTIAVSGKGGGDKESQRILREYRHDFFHRNRADMVARIHRITNTAQAYDSGSGTPPPRFGAQTGQWAPVTNSADVPTPPCSLMGAPDLQDQPLDLSTGKRRSPGNSDPANPSGKRQLYDQGSYQAGKMNAEVPWIQGGKREKKAAAKQAGAKPRQPSKSQMEIPDSYGSPEPGGITPHYISALDDRAINLAKSSHYRDPTLMGLGQGPANSEPKNAVKSELVSPVAKIAFSDSATGGAGQNPVGGGRLSQEQEVNILRAQLLQSAFTSLPRHVFLGPNHIGFPLREMSPFKYQLDVGNSESAESEKN